MDKELQLEDFNLDLYDEGNGEDDGVGVYSSVVGTNSSTSIVCATLTTSQKDALLKK